MLLNFNNEKTLLTSCTSSKIFEVNYNLLIYHKTKPLTFRSEQYFYQVRYGYFRITEQIKIKHYSISLTPSNTKFLKNRTNLIQFIVCCKKFCRKYLLILKSVSLYSYTTPNWVNPSVFEIFYKVPYLPLNQVKNN